MIMMKNEDYATFATRWFSTLTTIFGYPDGFGSHKNTRYVCIKTYLYDVSRDISSSLAYICGPFFLCHL